MKYSIPIPLCIPIPICIIVTTFVFICYKFAKSCHNDRPVANKNSFPELLGEQLEYAVKYLEKHYPQLKLYPIPDGAARIQDIQEDRVWLEYDSSNNKITIVPKIA